ncbi:MAG TPA: hypothetical protein VG056_15615 [Pirellulales bacterium]|jgi:hypothetical protein|nr:hypothetical protein [Pirellulales bacterium]
MKRWLLGIVGVCVFAAAFSLSAHRAQADNPQYLFIQPSYGGYGNIQPAQTYAYGWFGAAPRQQWTWHWDYYGDRWIWR